MTYLAKYMYIVRDKRMYNLYIWRANVYYTWLMRLQNRVHAFAFIGRACIFVYRCVVIRVRSIYVYASRIPGWRSLNRTLVRLPLPLLGDPPPLPPAPHRIIKKKVGWKLLGGVMLASIVRSANRVHVQANVKWKSVFYELYTHVHQLRFPLSWLSGFL